MFFKIYKVVPRQRTTSPSSDTRAHSAHGIEYRFSSPSLIPVLLIKTECRINTATVFEHPREIRAQNLRSTENKL